MNRNRAIPYVAAVAATGLAFLLRWAVDPMLGGSAQYLLYYFSVMFAAIVGGLWPGVLAVVLGAVAGTWFFIAAGHVGMSMADDALRLLMFLVFGGVTTLLAGRLRSARKQTAARAADLAQSIDRVKAAQEAQREGEQRFRSTFENAAVGITHIDPEGRWLRVNPRMCQMLGYTEQELQALRFADMTRPEHRSDDLRQYDLLMRGELDSYAVEKQYRRKDGQFLWVRVTRSAQRDESGRVIYSISIVEDIDARKRAQEALAQSSQNLQKTVEELRAAEAELIAQNHALEEAHSTLETETLRYRELFDAAPDGYVVTDRSGAIVEANRVALRILALTPELIHGIPLALFVEPHQRSKFRSKITTLRREGGVDSFQIGIGPKDGAKFQAEISASVEKPASEQPHQRMRWLIRDVTERVRAEESLRESEEKFRTLVENMPTAIGIVQDTRFVYANRFFAEMLGYSVQEILLMAFPQLVRPDYREMMLDRARRRQFGEPVAGNYEFIAMTKSGEERWIDFWPARITYKGRPAIIGAGLDITERKRAEEASRRSEEKFRILAEHTHDWEFWVAPDGRFLYNSPSCLNVTGYDVAAFERDPDLLDRIVHPEDRLLYDEHHGAGGRLCTNGEVEFRIIRRDGGIRWIGHTCMPVYDRAGQFLGIRGSNRDITERKLVEEQLAAAKASAERAQAAAEEASHAKDHFLAVLSHELRTPLTPVLATLSMIQEDARFDEDTSQSLEMMRRNIELETQLIDDLLDMTRIVRGRVQLDKKPVQLCTVIGRAVEVCRADMEARGLQFGVDLGPAAPYWVEADVSRLQQVFWNLLKNAIKFTPRGGRVGIRCRPDGDNGNGRVLAEVHDSGEGIEPDALARIFDAFEQARASANRLFGGLGLGLTITKALVEMHGGTIAAYSAGKGKGASFRLSLPLVPPQLRPAQQPPKAAPEAHERHPVKLRILFVEDHGDTAKTMKRLLERRGHEVQTAGDVATALELAGRELFDVLISDLGLPDGSGLDLMRRVRERGRELKGIALSGYGMEADVQRSRDAGFAEHLTKPVGLQELQDVIQRVTNPDA